MTLNWYKIKEISIYQFITYLYQKIVKLIKSILVFQC